ncbi:MAG: hypothetical protein ABL967_02375 [Bryobacteraceae bacterium]
MAYAIDKDKDRFVAGAASSYKGHQTSDKITIGAAPYVTDEETRKAFDKINPNKYGVLPVLVVIENNTGKAIRLDLQATYVGPNGAKLEATPAKDVIYATGVKKIPRLYEPLPNPLPRREKKGPLNIWQIPGREFSAKLIPPGETAAGFFYFQTPLENGSTIYLTGISDASSGKEYFYYEVPLERQ